MYESVVLDSLILSDVARHPPISIEYHIHRESVTMQPISIADPDSILEFLADVALRGQGVTTENLLEYVMDEGFMEPTYLSAKGEDPEAYYKGQSHAWEVYQVREWKRVLIISGGAGKERRMQITETP
jgi:hypothetical protein